MSSSLTIPTKKSSPFNTSLWLPSTSFAICPKKEIYRKKDIRGPRGQAAARQLEEPAGDGNDEVWVPYNCLTCGGRGHFASTCKRPHT
jgi:hypothetical protein